VLFLALLAILTWFAAFRAFYWACGFFLLLDDLLELFVTSGLLAVRQAVLDSNFKFCAFVINVLIMGRLRNQVVGSLV
jgi:hypothetical protein